MDRLMDRVRSNDAGHGPSSLQQENLALLRLHALTRRLLAMEDIDSALYAVLDAAIELQQADFGAIHVHHPVADKLRLAVQRGLANAYLDRFAEVGADNLSACARTLRAGEPIIIDDVERDDEYGPLRELAVQTGYRAVHATPLTTTAGRLIGILSLHFKRPCRPSAASLRLLDLHARHAADLLERLRADQALRAAHDEKKRFVAVLAHELRGPLAAVSNAVHILSKAGPGAAHHEAAVGIAQRQLGQLIRLVDDLFDLARTGHDKLTLVKERLPVKQVVDKALDVSRPKIDAAGIALQVSIDPPDLSVVADAVRLAQVVSNLLDNAAKFTPNGASVRLSCRESGSFAVIEVVDTGSGMSAATLARVFTPFEQETEEAGRNRGLGLGLPIARRIVEMHGGQISAQSDGVGKGCAFTVRIPR